MVIAVGSGSRIAHVLPELGGLLRQPLITLERVRICKRDGRAAGVPPAGHVPEPVRACRRERPATGVQAHGLHVRGGTPRRPARSPRYRAPTSHGRDQRRDDAAGHVGLSRRSLAAQSNATPVPVGPERPGRDDRDRRAGTHPGLRSTSSTTSPPNTASSRARRSPPSARSAAAAQCQGCPPSPKPAQLGGETSRRHAAAVILRRPD